MQSITYHLKGRGAAEEYNGITEEMAGNTEELLNPLHVFQVLQNQATFSSLTDEFKAAKARNLVTFQESKDPCIKGADIEVDAGRKANTMGKLAEARSRLKTQKIIGKTNLGREGLGMRKEKLYSKCSTKEQRSMIVSSVREKEEERRVVEMTQLSKQGLNLRSPDQVK